MDVKKKKNYYIETIVEVHKETIEYLLAFFKSKTLRNITMSLSIKS